MEWEKLLSKERFVKQEYEKKDIYRNDYDTIICSTLFRRLQDKAQVFPLEDDDYVRTRLTHSLEVSAIGKRLGELVFRQLKKQTEITGFRATGKKSFRMYFCVQGWFMILGNHLLDILGNMQCGSGFRLTWEN